MSLKKILDRSYSLLRRNTSQIIYVTMMMFAIEAAYGCIMFICACVCLPELSRPHWAADNLPQSYTPEVIAVLVFDLVIGFMIVTPLSFGAHWCFYQGAKGHPIPLECLFTCILNKDRRRKVWMINVVSSGSRIMIIAAAAALVRTCRVGLRQLDDIHADPEVYIIIYAATAAILTALTVFYMALTVRYFMVPFIFAENPDGSARQILLDSVRIVRGKKRQIIALRLLMMPLFSFSLFGFPLLLAIPVSRSLYAALALSFWESRSSPDQEDMYVNEYYI